MRLYAGPSPEFVKDSAHNRIADKLRVAFRSHLHYEPPASEVRSWRESLRALSQVFTEANLDDHGVILEYQLPLASRRLDCLVTGHDSEKKGAAVIVELKQWDRSELTEGEDLIRTYVGLGNRDVLHPSAQANQYRRYLLDMHEAFHGDDAVGLSACAYLHNYFAASTDPILDERFRVIRDMAPLFTADAVPALVEFLGARLCEGDGLPIMGRVEQSRFRPSKRLLDQVAAIIRNEPRFILLDEQQVVFSRVLASVGQGLDQRRKHVFLIHGGPGTGKSVLAINLMSELSARGVNAQYATGSRAFTRTMQKIVGRRAGQQFKYFNNYGQADPGIIDVLICDESHRIRASSNHRFTNKRKLSSKAQIQELVDASKVSVFFIDDRQVVRPGEVGSSALIKETADRNGCCLEEHRLEAQFRCQGSDAFVNWVDSTLGVTETVTPIWDQQDEAFELRIVDSPELLDEMIRARSNEGCTARLVAGFCWPWSKEAKADGSLFEDVEIGSFKRAWNARPDLKGLQSGIPSADHWAFDKRGLEQIGCIYTAQGFEFDYVGVIWGEDLTYDLDRGAWQGNPGKSFDTVVARADDDFTKYIQHAYRVLLTRGLKGCYIHFVDRSAEQFVRTRTRALEGLARVFGVPKATPAPQPLAAAHNAEPGLPFKRLRPSDVKPYVNSVPLVDLKFAAGSFTPSGMIDQDEVDWVELPDHFRPRSGLFVAQVVGDSMNRRIPNGSWCLFALGPVGSRQGRVVLVQHHRIHDPDFGGAYTVKIYTSTKSELSEGEWRHERIVLLPSSDSAAFKPISIPPTESDDLRVIAELVAVLS